MFQLETLTTNTILSFTHHLDWPVMKPYLVCRTFHQIFTNKQFEKDYLINLFKLSRLDQVKLKEVIDHFSWKGPEEQIPSDYLENGKKMKKKRKLSEKKRKFEPFTDTIDVYSAILRLFVKCSLPRFVKPVTVSKYDTVDTLEEVRKKIVTEQASVKFLQNFKELVHGQLTFLERNRKVFECVPNEMMGGYKGVFMLDYSIRFDNLYGQNNEHRQECEFVIFTRCGFPLVFRNVYYVHVISEGTTTFVDDMYFGNICNSGGITREIVEVYSPFGRNKDLVSLSKWEEEFFRHSVPLNLDQGPEDFNIVDEKEYNKKVFKGVLMALFDSEAIDHAFLEKSEIEREKALGNVLYKIFESCFIELQQPVRHSKNRILLYPIKSSLRMPYYGKWVCPIPNELE